MTVFSYNGIDLSTLGAITEISGYLDMPERRGDNATIPARDGAIYADKYYAERQISFGIALNASNLAGLEAALDAARAVFGVRGQHPLMIVMSSGETRTAQASVERPLQVARFGPSMARLVVEFALAYPFFVGAVTNSAAISVSSSPVSAIVANSGTAEHREPRIVLTGSLQNVSIQNLTTGVTLGYNAVIASGETITIGASGGQFTATLTPGDINVIGNITHSGSTSLMTLAVGANNITVASAATGGTVIFEYENRYF